MRRLWLNQQGITIVELVLAIVIIGVGLVALSSAIPIAAYGIQEGNQLSTATFLANQRLEQVRNSQWRATPAVDTLGLSASGTSAPVGAGGAVTFPDETPMAAPFGGYSRVVRISSCGVAPGCSGVQDAGLRQVTVTVSYQPMTGIGVAPATTSKSAIVTMYIAQR